MEAFWAGFEKRAKPLPGPALDYAAMRAAELVKKRAVAGPTINYAAHKLAPKLRMPAVKASVPQTAADVLKERRNSVARGGVPHTTWAKMVEG